MNENEGEINQTGITIETDVFETKQFANLQVELENYHRKKKLGEFPSLAALDEFFGEFEFITTGCLISAFQLAQKYWRDNGRSLIPFKEWDDLWYGHCLIKCGFAEKRENGIYVFGIKEQCLGLGL